MKKIKEWHFDDLPTKNCKEFPSLQIGMKAPDFTADTTHGRFSLSDFKGEWLILFSHPADFTPVCTTEFLEFSKIYEKLKSRKVNLLGLSVDSVSSHIAWVRSINERMGVEIPFPIASDLSTEISKKYGMIHPIQSSTETIRGVFFIDPKGILRTMLYYPMSVGRNFNEIIRVVDALQTSDKFKCATPANWQMGDNVVVLPPKTIEEADRNIKNKKYEVTTWYLCKKNVKL